MKYIETTIYTSPAGIEPVCAMLSELGIESLIVENPEDVTDFMNKKNSYDWDYVDDKVMALAEVEANVKFYLENSMEGEKSLDDIRINAMMLKSKEYEGIFGPGVTLGRLYVQNIVVDDEDWKDNWKEYFKTVRVTDRLVIKPSWEEYTKEKGSDLVIEIDPGMAFGTGTHATTSLCLKLLEKHLRPGDAVLDVGCGSGILSIAAALLGAEKTKGIEIDPVAVEISRENVALNRLENKIDIDLGDLTKGIDFKGDIVVANLMADLVIMLTEDVAKHLNVGGIYISSGILMEKQSLVTDKIKQWGFDIVDILEQDDWCAIAATYKG